jgi:ubiquinone/menaquinone biosynthesis C-methylase UbiE
MMTTELVKEYYSASVRKEWKRLVQDAYHRLEFDTTLHYFSKYLPEKGLILDAGGGPGRYTLELARRGLDVILLDFVPANLAFARRQIKKIPLRDRVKALVEASITDLSQFEDGSFDAVVCTGGPLSHVVDPSQREQAIRELVRVAKPGAPIFVSVMSRLSLLVVELVYFQPEIEMPHFQPLRDSGDYFGGSGFTACHFFLPEELRAEFAAQPVTLLEMVGLEGISSNHSEKLNRLAKDPQRWKIWLETHFATCAHQAVVGMSEHILLVCRKGSG